MNKCWRCGEDNEGDPLWLEMYCQRCWEYYAAALWWEGFDRPVPEGMNW